MATPSYWFLAFLGDGPMPNAECPSVLQIRRVQQAISVAFSDKLQDALV